MSTLKIWETPRGHSGLPVLILDDRMNYQTVSFTATPGLSAAFDDDTSIITVKSDVACAVRVANGSPVATVNDYPLDANTGYDFEVQPGAKISVIAT